MRIRKIPKELNGIVEETAKEMKLPKEIIEAVVNHWYRYINDVMGSALFGEIETYDNVHMPGLGTFYTTEWKVKRLIMAKEKAARMYKKKQLRDKLIKQENFLRDD